MSLDDAVRVVHIIIERCSLIVCEVEAIAGENGRIGGCVCVCEYYLGLALNPKDPHIVVGGTRER